MYNAEFWFAILAFSVLMYVILDGFDLGLGILYPWFKSPQERGLMMSSIAHVWDGNETWLVFGGVILFAAFPKAYAMLLSGVYLPVIVMLLALVMRGAAFEYRFKSTTSTVWWDRAFALGSSTAAFCQGFILGTVVDGKVVDGKIIQGDVIAASGPGLSLFPVLTGFAVMAGYALLGCGWMMIKKTPDMQIRAAKLAQMLTVIVLVSFIGVSLYSVLTNPLIWQRWFSWPNVLLLSPLPLLAMTLGGWLYLHCGYLAKTIKPGQTPTIYRLPFILTVLLFMLGFAGLWIGMHPYLIPGQLTLYDALAPKSSLSFVFYGVVALLPVILIYTFYGYRVFGGKAEAISQLR
ncbi:MAG: cytochrome d ubiquinol oxidase subunit II [Algicola sp.]|nr:cytochrome d ubiquinol oxidase subunit II [Algicola sp.]